MGAVPAVNIICRAYYDSAYYDSQVKWIFRWWVLQEKNSFSAVPRSIQFLSVGERKSSRSRISAMESA
jgi:hypothetical protein